MEGSRRGTPSEQLNLPAGFRFHPTDEELVVNYLLHKSESRPFPIPIIAEVDLYKFDPWELPEKALFGEREWYFFSPRDRKYPNGARPNRAAASGYWKATGTDKPIQSKNKKVGVKKALVFYKGKAPKGIKTNWIMHEYRVAESSKTVPPLASVRKKGSLRLDDWVLCRIYKKSSGAFKVMVSATPKSTGIMKTEPEEELDEVLASLPDIDENGPRFKLPNIGGAPTPVAHRSFFSPSPVFDEMFSPEQDTSTDNGSASMHQQQQAISFHPSSSLTDTANTTTTTGYVGYHDNVYPGDNHGSYNSTMVMLNKVNPWAFEAPVDVKAGLVVGGGRIINPPPIKLEKVPSNISDILLQIQQQNAMAVNSKKRTRLEDEDDVQSTCRSPVPRQTRQGFGFDFSQLQQQLNY